MPLRFLLALALLAPTAALAQPSPEALPEASVRYDADLLPASFHAERRAALASAIPAGAVAVVLGAPERTRSNDVKFEYRQDNDLYYLTGATEPGTALLLAPEGVEVDGETVTEVLFLPERNPQSEVWTGRLIGPERAPAMLGVRAALPLARFAEVLDAAAGDGEIVLLSKPEGIGEGSALASQWAAVEAHGTPMPSGVGRILPFLNRLTPESFAEARPGMLGSRAQIERFAPEAAPLLGALAEAETYEAWAARRDAFLGGFLDTSTLREALDMQRSVKTAAEIALLQKAIDITAEAQREAMRSIEPGMHEYEIEALVEYVFKRNGAEYPGFPSIIGSGENATILHYESNRRQMAAGDMVVMDIGAEVHGYSADVTRTVPVDGDFSDEERTIYQLVLDAQAAGIEATRAGNGFGDPGRAASAVIASGLMELGLISEEREVRRFFMHGTSHYLGLDVHDVGPGGELLPGQVITVEPGIYIAPAADVDPKWWNIGVRIEDDVLVTSGDPVVMSAGAPRTVDEIEALMAESGLGNEPAGRIGG